MPGTNELTQLDVAMARADALEVIPPMTDPNGHYWDQPARSEILVDDTHAVMTTATFRKLAEYSATNPSGVYPGKMWRRHNGAHDLDFLRRGGKPEWLLCWYGYSSKGPDFCSTNYRTILLSDGDIGEVRR